MQEIVGWLFDGWKAEFPLAVVEGFAGVGKTTSVRNYFKAWSGPKVLVTLVEGALYEEFLLGVVSEIEMAGIKNVGDSGDWEQDIVRAVQDEGLLLVLDNFETQLDADGIVLSVDLRRLLAKLASVHSGRVCIVSSRSPSPDEWTERSQYRTMSQLGSEQGVHILRTMLEERQKLDGFDEALLVDVSVWLGNNPRAMRAFVACLIGQPLEEMIERDRESWELRHTPRSAQLTARLERDFWHQSLGRLDPESVTLAENLSVFRRPFRVEAIRAAGATIHNWENARNRLALSFILDRSNAWYELNPVVRQLTSGRLVQLERRHVTAHARAADFFAKRIDASAYRDANTAGGYFVEARHHYRAAGRDDMVDAIAGKYRGLLLRAYRGSQIDLTDAAVARERIPILLAALDHDDEGFEPLRAALTQLLEARGAEGDDYTALRHARLASQVKTPLAFWMAYTRIAVRVETDAFLISLAKRAIDRCAREPERVVVAISEQLFLRGQAQMALRLIDEASASISRPADVYLIRLKSFILDRTGNFAGAFEVMLARHREGGPGKIIDRLLEEATFLAFQHEAIDRLVEVVSYAVSVQDSLTKQSASLAFTLTAMLRGDYREALRAAEGGSRDGAVAAQAIFCHLALGQFTQAAEAMTHLGGVRNAASRWLSAVVALCNGDADTYIDSISNVTDQVTTDMTMSDEKLWMHVWNDVPARMAPFPSYYFPRLPPRLTGLDRDIVRTHHGGSQVDLIRHSLPLKGSHATESPAVPSAPVIATSNSGAPIIYVQEGTFDMGKQEYVNNGQVGSMGYKAKVDGDITQNQIVLPSVSEALRELADFARASDQEAVAETLDEVNALESASDRATATGRFREVRAWVVDKATDGAVAIAAGLTLAAFGG
ncbi:hypothetical protein [Microbacterium oxydans]|uniref:hypothetical protein n=1 Tax=Microbacterium oxydans TaxID=82380 RepID=UPI00367183D8